MENKQTAVEWLIEQLIPKDQHEGIIDIIEEAKEIEKEQSLNFAKHCLDKAKDLDVRTAFFNVEQYYNETFNTKEK
jgi:hypothetical protein